MKRKKNSTAAAMFAAIALTAVVGVILLIAGLISAPDKTGKNDESAQTEETEPEFTLPEITPVVFEPIELGSGITVVNLSSYAGMYVEDGSNEIVSGIAVATVENNGTDDVQLLNFTLSADDGTAYDFELTTLLPGDRMTVLERSRKPYDGKHKNVSGTVNSFGVFAEKPSLHEDILKITCANNVITVKNLSDQTLSAGRIFYKNQMGELLIGGITYMSSFQELTPGRELQLSASHFSEENSRIVFVTYAE